MMQALQRRLHRAATTLVALGILSIGLLAHTGSGIAVDRLGQVYFLDTGSGPWKIDAQGALSRMPGPRFHWLALDPNDAFNAGTLASCPDGEIERSGKTPTLLVSSDYPIAIGQDGNLHYPVRAGGELRVMRMTPSGVTSVLATLPATANGPLLHLNGLCTGPENSIYCTSDRVIWRISAQGAVSSVATIPAPVGSASIPGIESGSGPCLRGLAVDSAGVVFVAASGSASVLKIPLDGKVTTLLRIESPWSPTAVALHGGDVYVLEYLHTPGEERLEWLPRVRKIAADGAEKVIATVDRMPGARR